MGLRRNSRVVRRASSRDAPGAGLAQAYYGAEAPHETERFVDEFFATARRLTDFPYSSPELRRGARRTNLRVFPYQLWYRVHDDARVVEIIAVLHHRENPDQVNDPLEPQSGD